MPDWLFGYVMQRESCSGSVAGDVAGKTSISTQFCRDVASVAGAGEGPSR